MIQIIIKYGRPIVLAVTKAAGSIPPILSWVWGTATTINWGTSTPDKLWGVPESATVAVNTNPPSISGTAVVGQTLTAIPGTWTGIATINGNWQRNGVDIVGAKLLNYTLVQADAGNTSNITYLETATNTAGSAVATSNQIAQILTVRTNSFLTASAISDTTIRGALNTLDVGLISNSLDTKMKALYPFVGGTASTHKFNFMNSADTNAAFRLAFSPTGWTHSNTGALPNGTNAFADTFFIPSVDASTSGFGFGVYSRVDDVTGTKIYGANQSAINITQQNFSNGNFINGTLASNIINFTAAPSTRFMYNRRNSTTDMQAYRDGVSLGTNTAAAIAMPNCKFYFGARNTITNTPDIYDTHEIAFAVLDIGLTNTQALSLSTLVNNFQTTLGRQV